MAIVKDVIEILKDFAPEQHQYNGGYDNVGLLCGDQNSSVTKVLVCLDVTDAVLNEAASVGAELVISHHPFIYGSINRVNAEGLTGRKIIKAISSGVAVYSAHTNLDFVKEGINDYIAVSLGLRNVVPLIPYISESEGAGRVGDLSNKVFCAVLKGEVETMFADTHVRVAGELTTLIKRVAVVNGGGGGDTEFVDLAVAAGADCLITADVKHHVALYAREIGLTIIEPQHYNMEYAFIPRLCQIMKIEAKSRNLGVEISAAKSETNPRI